MNKAARKIVLGVAAFALTITVSLSGRAYAANVNDMAHKTGISTNKVWTIKLSKRLDPSMAKNLSSYVCVTSPKGYAGVSLSYNDSNKTIIINPPSGGYSTSTTYTITVKENLKDVSGNKIEAPTIMEFSTVNSSQNVSGLGTVSRYQLNYSLDTLVNNQLKYNPFVVRYFYEGYAEATDVRQYTDPQVFMNDSYGIYQFMNLNYMDSITVDNLQAMLNGEGILSGMGQAFQNACKTANVNQAYAVSHAILETGHGSSQLAKGVEVTDKSGNKVKVYNFFGIGAYDSDPINGGAQYALNQGWTTPEKALEGGIKWIGSSYINSSYKQNTLYKMKWNATSSGVPAHQYATDIAWAYKQVSRIKQILDKSPSTKVKFDIPSYK